MQDDEAGHEVDGKDEMRSVWRMKSVRDKVDK
jgi:hypothetical protein